MSDDREYQRMFARHPLARTPYGDPPSAECLLGWLSLIDAAFSELDGFGLPYDVRQVKEKLGDLRMYIWPPAGLSPDEQARWQDILDLYTARSAYICEQCGRAGRLRKRPSGWFLTACEEHADGGALGYATPVEGHTIYRGRAAGAHGSRPWERYDPTLDAWIPCEAPE